jgi:molybdopterin molybdotransferase
MARELIEIDHARRLVLEHARPLAGEHVPTREGLGRVLAEDVAAAEDVPGFDNSAMDGFALLAADTAGARSEQPVELTIVDESRAGRPAGSALAPGQAIRISTGAMLPAGADAVVRVEDTAESDGRAQVRVEAGPGRDVRRAGEDIRAGDVVLRTGTRLGPAELGVLASVDRAEVVCSRRPRVALLTTGDELLEPGTPPRPGAIRDSNAYSVSAQAQRAGAEVSVAGHVPDDYDATVEALRSALGADVIAVCGGVSVGEHDHVKPAFAELGVAEVFWGVALRPGRPTWFGVHEQRETLAFGLPGNPVSAMITFHLFVRPALAALVGTAVSEQRTFAVLDEDYAKRPGRAHAVRCFAEARDDGWHVRPTGAQGSHILTSMLGANALAVLERERGDVRAGERVRMELLDP